MVCDSRLLSSLLEPTRAHGKFPGPTTTAPRNTSNQIGQPIEWSVSVRDELLVAVTLTDTLSPTRKVGRDNSTTTPISDAADEIVA